MGGRNGLHRTGRLGIGKLVDLLGTPIHQVTNIPTPFSPVSSGVNFGELWLGRACSDRGGSPGFSGSFSSPTFLRHSVCQVFNCGRIMPQPECFVNSAGRYCHLSKNAIDSAIVFHSRSISGSACVNFSGSHGWPTKVYTSVAGCATGEAAHPANTTILQTTPSQLLGPVILIIVQSNPKPSCNPAQVPLLKSLSIGPGT